MLYKSKIRLFYLQAIVSLSFVILFYCHSCIVVVSLEVQLQQVLKDIQDYFLGLLDSAIN